MNHDNKFYFVGIGASAGGLEALEQFFSKIPSSTGIAFIIIQHLDPTHKGVMPELLQRVTQLKVIQVTDGIKVQPNHIYVIPPNSDMSILHGRLHLLEPSAPRGFRLPIDYFFRSLAEDQRENSVGIILSGMGTDGTIGLKAIKEKLGMVMAQEPDSAKYDGMPRSAVETGLVDFIDTPAILPQKLLDYTKYKKVPIVKGQIDNKLTSGIEKIFILLRDKTGHDFSLYKKNTIYRRVEKRMIIHQIDKIATYVRFLQENPQEIELLFKELLINVTNFFRDPEAYEILKKKALTQILKDNRNMGIFRVWVPGCASGEEAYSIAIIIKEIQDELKLKNSLKVQIFATDLSKDVIDKARRGVFPANIATDVSKERLKKYFIKDNDNFQISKELREMVIFAYQNIITDPPFTKMNLISCRNVMIYFSQELQKKIISILHYSLLPSGILFLGPSETISGTGELFSSIDAKWRIYSKQDSLSLNYNIIDFPSLIPTFTNQKNVSPKGEAKLIYNNLQFNFESLLLQKFVPASVLIKSNGDILFIQGKTGKYLEPSEGLAKLNIFAMAREGLKYELSNIIQRVKKHKTEITHESLKVKSNGGYQLVNVTVKPIQEHHSLYGLFLVYFEDVNDVQDTKKRKIKSIDNKSHQEGRIKDLESELMQTKEYLEGLIEEMQTSQEELKSANEELQSTNEELQSTNEELITSKEEMQSLNEELISLNTELQNKIEELSKANNDLKNLLNSIDLATIFLDNNLNIRRFTNITVKFFNLINSDIGRSINDIKSKLLYDSLEEDVTSVMESLIFREIEVESKDGKWFLLRIMPYRTFENVIDGVVMVFYDITKNKELEKIIKEKEVKIKLLEKGK